MACILLLCLQAHDFPVDTNVGRICARMGWLPFDQEKPLEVRFFLSKSAQVFNTKIKVCVFQYCLV